MNYKYYELTNPQKSIWLTEQFYKGTSIENITGTATILEKANLEILTKAINLFIKKNDSYRLKFKLDNNSVKQYISDYNDMEFEHIHLSSEKELKNIENEMANMTFDIFDSFLFKFKLFELPNGNGGFVITTHHLISDAWTSGLVVSQIMDFYSALSTNLSISVDSFPSYIDYINSEQEYLQSKKFQTDKQFWTSLYSTIPEVATLPSLMQNSTSNISSASRRKHFVISKETISKIDAFCKENKFSIFNFFMGILAIYIGRVSNLDEFVIRNTNLKSF